MEKTTKLFNRDFTLVVIGQIISLFGNAILRFALPFYLLKETGSSTLFVVQIYTMVQQQTPTQLVGKLMAALIAVAMCGQPAGQMVYGILFDVFSKNTWVVFLIASIASILISWYSKRIFARLEN